MTTNQMNLDGIPAAEQITPEEIEKLRKSIIREREFGEDGRVEAWETLAVIEEYRRLRVQVDAALAVQAQLLDLVRDLIDPEPCWFDHHGGCQAHGYLSLEPGELCPHAEAKEVLDGRAAPRGRSGETEGEK